jgi:RAB6A-GEF complex partner protein 2
MPSDIQVYVLFKEQRVFAGEDIQSVITFKNVASISENIVPDTNATHSRSRATSGTAGEHQQPKASGGLSSQNPRLAAINSHGTRNTSKSGHRATASLTIPFTGSPVSRSTSWTASPVADTRPSHTHKRSVSIISLGSPDVGNETTRSGVFPPRSRPTINNGRSASHQVRSTRIDGNYDGSPSCEHHCLFSRIPPDHF